MIKQMFNKPTKWSVMKTLILKDIDDLIINSMPLCLLFHFLGGVITIKQLLNPLKSFDSKYLVGFATHSQSSWVAPTFISMLWLEK